jgi:2',3'-cyclic-nucleotide 2'-phosphodiesterase (5'-nucleotidase family)
MKGVGLAALFGIAAVASAAVDAGAPPVPAAAPALSGSARVPDVLTMAKAKLDPDAPRTIGKCDPNAPKDKARFTLAHMNDLQARYSDRIAGKSRYAWAAGYLNLLKTAQPTLALDAGDDYEKGSLAELRSNGETTRQMIQAIPFDVRTIGNHDFGYGENVVLRDVRLSSTPVLAANLRHPGMTAAKQPFRPYARFDVGCVKVGVIGLITQNYGADDQPNSTPFDDVIIQDRNYAATLDREAKAHRSEVDVLIALTHLGYVDDLALARKVATVDFVVGGHSEDTLKEPGVVTHGKTKTWVLQAGHFAEKIGHGEVIVNLKDRSIVFEKYRMVDVDDKLPSGPLQPVDDLARKLEDAVEPDLQKPIGKSANGVTKGAQMADLIAKATKEIWNLDALVVGKDLFWAGVPKGEVTLQKLYETVLVQKQPTGTNGISSIWVQEMPGDDAAALFRSFQPAGKYQWSGLAKFEPTKKYKIGFDKRAATFPRALFGAASKSVHAAFLGEMIDALEPWARARTAKGQTIDL